jgi:hypothetical protein
VITTSTGAVQLWEQDQLVWGREESLAAINRAAFVELPLPERVARVNLEGESFVSRLTRQIEDAKVCLHSFLRYTSTNPNDRTSLHTQRRLRSASSRVRHRVRRSWSRCTTTPRPSGAMRLVSGKYW